MTTRRSRAEMIEDTRAKLIAAGREAFARQGYAAASMDDLTASAGLTRGALYHHFGDKRGLLQAVVDQIDTEMALAAKAVAAAEPTAWERLLAEGVAYIEMALRPEVQRIVLLDGPAVLGDPSRWPSQHGCLQSTAQTLTALIAEGVVVPVDVEAAARLMNGAALNAALWVAGEPDPQAVLPRAIDAFLILAGGFKATR
ncbi:MAG: TetR/AcrR family transcriptional regulator [Brevundimonas sp.]|nr:TetR/AcrR family transcriptional regulator [Brevundimonas sp.]